MGEFLFRSCETPLLCRAPKHHCSRMMNYPPPQPPPTRIGTTLPSIHPPPTPRRQVFLVIGLRLPPPPGQVFPPPTRSGTTRPSISPPPRSSGVRVHRPGALSHRLHRPGPRRRPQGRPPPRGPPDPRELGAVEAFQHPTGRKGILGGTDDLRVGPRGPLARKETLGGTEFVMKKGKTQRVRKATQ